jgi:hypothetical protein
MESQEKTVAHVSTSIAEEHIARHRASGKTQVAYCEEHGIKKATFAYWLKRQRDARNAGPEGFVRITTSERSHAMEICYTNGIVVRFNGHVDPKYIKELIG